MKPQPELVGQEAVAAEPIHDQIFFEGFHEVLGLPAIHIMLVQIFGREILSVRSYCQKLCMEPSGGDLILPDSVDKCHVFNDLSQPAVAL